MLKQIAIKSKNYVYVYHTGTGDNLCLMGMTHEQYDSALRKGKGSYNVLCWLYNNKSLDENKQDLEMDFNTPEEYRNTPVKVSKKEAVDCLSEFYSEGLDKKLSNLTTAKYIVDISNWVGVPLNGVYETYKLFSEHISKGKIVSDVIVDFSDLAHESFTIGKKVYSYGDYVRNRSSGKRNYKYLLFHIAENDITTIIGKFLCVDDLLEFTPDMSMSDKKVYDFVCNENKFVLI